MFFGGWSTKNIVIISDMKEGFQLHTLAHTFRVALKRKINGTWCEKLYNKTTQHIFSRQHDQMISLSEKRNDSHQVSI